MNLEVNEGTTPFSMARETETKKKGSKAKAKSKPKPRGPVKKIAGFNETTIKDADAILEYFERKGLVKEVSEKRYQRLRPSSLSMSEVRY